VADAGHPADVAQTVDRLASSGFLFQELSQDSLNNCEEECSSPLMRRPLQNLGRAVEYPGRLPSHFLNKLAEMVAKDEELQRRLKAGGTQGFTWNSRPSRFLQACTKGDEKLASDLWKRVSVLDQQELLWAYSCGAPSPDFFVKIMSRDSISTC
jgi:hypothetical protein